MLRDLKQVQEWYQMYLQGLEMQEIDKMFNTDCSYHFKKHNLRRRTSSEVLLKRKGRYKILNDLSQINSETEAYILGLWFSDGWITSRNQAGITLHKDDFLILEKIKNIICPELSLLYERNNSKLLISSQHFKNNLEKYGITVDKSYSDFKLPEIQNHLRRHFVRGYFDGDGTIYYDKKHLRVNICSITLQILKDIQKELNLNNIYSVINTEIREGKTYKVPTGHSNNCKNIHRLFIRRKADLKLLYEYLYKDATIYLDRKYNKFLNYINTEVNNQITKG